MANDTPPDPGAGFRDLVTQWERDFNAFANQVMGTEGFSQAMNQAQIIHRQRSIDAIGAARVNSE